MAINLSTHRYSRSITWVLGRIFYQAVLGRVSGTDRINYITLVLLTNYYSGRANNNKTNGVTVETFHSTSLGGLSRACEIGAHRHDDCFKTIQKISTMKKTTKESSKSSETPGRARGQPKKEEAVVDAVKTVSCCVQNRRRKLLSRRSFSNFLTPDSSKNIFVSTYNFVPESWLRTCHMSHVTSVAFILIGFSVK